VTRTPRQRQSEHDTIQAAADRLLAGTPLRSSSGRLTASELITECGLRRDVVYNDHKHLVEAFQARVKAQHSTPEAMRELTERNTQLTADLARARADLAAEQATSAALRQAIAELSLEFHQAREELAAAANIARLPVRAGQNLIGPC
jgi:Tfp pilus assembly protein FimV